MEQVVREIVGGEWYEYVPLGEYVVRAVGVCGMRPTFKYTRIEIAGALDRLAGGESMDSLIAGYQGRVSRAAIEEAIGIVTRHFISGLPDMTAVG